MTQHAPGKLWIVATPIGNLDDLSARAQAILRQADLIAAEDTRHSAALLQHYAIATRRVALHEHNEREASADLVQRMRDGAQIALISDAGTPLVSDPGFRLVRAAREAGIVVSPVPGACAAIAALSAAGLPSDRFVFEGFLPAKPAARRTRLQALRGETRTLIFYESSHRIVEALDDLAGVFGGDRHAVVARELTKLFETMLDDSLAGLAARISNAANSSFSLPAPARRPTPRASPKAVACSNCCAAKCRRARLPSSPPRSPAQRAMRCIAPSRVENRFDHAMTPPDGAPCACFAFLLLTRRRNAIDCAAAMAPRFTALGPTINGTKRMPSRDSRS
jgi:16S rRNA (cytidine1402-2'-O)-methyltransferase